MSMACRIGVYSDLHLEFGPFEIPENDVDIMIFAGDIDTGLESLHYVADYADEYPQQDIIYITGNHEYYHHDLLLDEDIEEYLETIYKDLSNIHFLQKKSMLWRDTSLYISGGIGWGSMGGGNPISMEMSRVRMNDYKQILGCTPERTYALSQEYRAFFEQEGQHAQKMGYTWIVVTHHAPSQQSAEGKYRDDTINGAYVNELEDIIVKYAPHIWVHGHMHNSVDYYIHQTRIVSNPRGYYGYQLNPHFQELLVLEIEV